MSPIESNSCCLSVISTVAISSKKIITIIVCFGANLKGGNKKKGKEKDKDR